MSAALSRRRIDRAGETLRDWWKDPGRDVDDEIHEALTILWEYRLSFRKPLKKVTAGLRQFVQRESSQTLVSERLKRLPTIVDKLVRLPTMKVTRMQDIGGCRAVLANRSEIDGVLRRVHRNWQVKRVYDRIAQPKDTGYRAIHVIVERDRREIEIQLRTYRQHAWATAVERLGAQIGFPLKDGQGPRELLDVFRDLADILALHDEGRSVDKKLMAQVIERLALEIEASRRRYGVR